MKKTKRLLIILLLLIIGPIEFLYVQPLVQEKLGTVEAVTFTKEIMRGDTINAADVRVQKIKSEYALKDRITDPSIVIGQEATRKIYANEQAVKDMVVLDKLTPRTDQKNMPLPAEWVLSAPGSLLRGDNVTLVPVFENSDRTQTTADTGSDGEVIVTRSEPITVNSEDQRLLTDIAVSFARSSNNQDVTTEDGRSKPTGQVNRIELVVTEAQRDVIVKYGRNNFKFIVTYG